MWGAGSEVPAVVFRLLHHGRGGGSDGVEFVQPPHLAWTAEEGLARYSVRDNHLVSVAERPLVSVSAVLAHVHLGDRSRLESHLPLLPPRSRVGHHGDALEAESHARERGPARRDQIPLGPFPRALRREVAAHPGLVLYGDFLEVLEVPAEDPYCTILVDVVGSLLPAQGAQESVLQVFHIPSTASRHEYLNDQVCRGEIANGWNDRAFVAPRDCTQCNPRAYLERHAHDGFHLVEGGDHTHAVARSAGELERHALAGVLRDDPEVSQDELGVVLGDPLERLLEEGGSRHEGVVTVCEAHECFALARGHVELARGAVVEDHLGHEVFDVFLRRPVGQHGGDPRERVLVLCISLGELVHQDGDELLGRELGLGEREGELEERVAADLESPRFVERGGDGGGGGGGHGVLRSGWVCGPTMCWLAMGEALGPIPSLTTS